jgi:hypothetical protein
MVTVSVSGRLSSAVNTSKLESDHIVIHFADPSPVSEFIILLFPSYYSHPFLYIIFKAAVINVRRNRKLHSELLSQFHE